MATTYSYIKGQANEFMDRWLSDMGNLQGMYDTSAEMIDSLGSLSAQLGQEYDEYQQLFTPYRDQILDMASADGERRAQLSDQFMNLAVADYQGASNRAVADAAVQGDIARQGMVRELNRRGTTSGARMENEVRKSYLDEARTRTLASTVAQQGEKNRALSASATGIQVFDPNRSIETASQIQQGANDLLTARGQLDTAQANLQTNLANSYSDNVTRELGDAAGTYEGMRIAEGVKRDAALAEEWEKDRQDRAWSSIWYRNIDVPSRTDNPYLK